MSEWIDVKTEIPPRGEAVIVALRDGLYVDSGYFLSEHNDKWGKPTFLSALGGYFHLDSITHWMPLPPPPKGGSNG